MIDFNHQIQYIEYRYSSMNFRANFCRRKLLMQSNRFSKLQAGILYSYIATNNRTSKKVAIEFACSPHVMLCKLIAGITMACIQAALEKAAEISLYAQLKLKNGISCFMIAWDRSTCYKFCE